MEQSVGRSHKLPLKLVGNLSVDCSAHNPACSHLYVLRGKDIAMNDILYYDFRATWSN